jgi:hypothetical protein
MMSGLSDWCHDIQYNDIPPDGIQHNKNQSDDIQHNNNQHDEN